MGLCCVHEELADGHARVQRYRDFTGVRQLEREAACKPGMDTRCRGDDQARRPHEDRDVTYPA